MFIMHFKSKMESYKALLSKYLCLSINCKYENVLEGDMVRCSQDTVFLSHVFSLHIILQ